MVETLQPSAAIIRDNEVRRPPEIRQDTGRHCMFISGLGGGYAGLKGIQAGLESLYGPKNVTIINSIVSPDEPDPHRFQRIANVIRTHATTGLDIPVHSLGATELWKAIKVIEKEDSTFFDRPENTENLGIVLIGPSGSSKGLKEKYDYLKGYVRILRKHDMRTPLAKKHTLERGLGSFGAFPSEIPDASIHLRNTAPEGWSNMRNGVQSVPFVPGRTNENYLDTFLSPDAQLKLAALDMEIHIASSRGDYAKVSELVAERGDITTPALSEIFEGTLEPNADENNGKRGASHTGSERIGEYHDSCVGRKPVDKFQELSEKGVTVNWLVPEYDFLVPIHKTLRFYDSLPENAADHVKVEERTTHQSAPATQPELLAKIIFQR